MTPLENLISAAKTAKIQLRLEGSMSHYLIECGCDSCGAIKALSEAIESADRSPWTRCADGLPKVEEGQMCRILVTGDFGNGRFVFSYEYWGEKLPKTFIAWMPFPEPLKE